MIWQYIFFIVVGFLSGSIMYSYFFPKFFMGIDIIKESSDHNPGTANAIKYAGISIGIICLICDVLKGFFPIYIALSYLDESNILFSFVMAAPVLGHAFSPVHKLKGGKSIAVSFGVFIGMTSNISLLISISACLIFFSVIFVVRPHALRVIISFGFFSMYCLFFVPVFSIAAGSILISAIVIYKHIMSYKYEQFEVGFFLWYNNHFLLHIEKRRAKYNSK